MTLRNSELSDDEIADKKKRTKKWKEKNKQRHSELNKESSLRNQEKVRQRVKRYAKENPEIMRVCGSNRRARVKKAEGKFTKKDVLELLRNQDYKCAGCLVCVRTNKYHVDHIMPLCLGGTNWPSNLQILCAKCNMTKHAMHPEKWLEKIKKEKFIK